MAARRAASGGPSPHAVRPGAVKRARADEDGQRCGDGTHVDHAATSPSHSISASSPSRPIWRRMSAISASAVTCSSRNILINRAVAFVVGARARPRSPGAQAHVAPERRGQRVGVGQARDGEAHPSAGRRGPAGRRSCRAGTAAACGGARSRCRAASNQRAEPRVARGLRPRGQRAVGIKAASFFLEVAGDGVGDARVQDHLSSPSSGWRRGAGGRAAVGGDRHYAVAAHIVSSLAAAGPLRRRQPLHVLRVVRVRHHPANVWNTPARQRPNRSEGTSPASGCSNRSLTAWRPRRERWWPSGAATGASGTCQPASPGRRRRGSPMSWPAEMGSVRQSTPTRSHSAAIASWCCGMSQRERLCADSGHAARAW